MRSFKRQITLAEQVGDNNWGALPVVELGGWSPSLAVAVVIPAYQNQAQLDRTLLGFERQTYPSELLSVVVVDDGSKVPLSTPSSVGKIPVTVIHQEDKGFRAGTARNLGAGSARSDIVVFLDSDMYPEPQMIEAHARWHHQVGYALVVGMRKHADLTKLTKEALLESGDTLERVVGPGATPAWIERLMEGTNDFKRNVGPLTEEGKLTYRELWRGVSSGNLSLRRETFDQVGGFFDYGEWGGEDNEFGHRAANQGVLMIVDRRALAWHDGESTSARNVDRKLIERSQARLAAHIPSPSLRKEPGRRHEVPAIWVEMIVENEPSEEVFASIDSLLSGSLQDIRISLDISPSRSDHGRITDSFQDARVDFAKRYHHPGTPFRLTTRPLTYGPKALEELSHMPPDTGRFRIYVNGVEPDQCPQFSSVRALNRCRRLGWNAEEVGFRGVYRDEWVSGARLGVRAGPYTEEPPTHGD